MSARLTKAHFESIAQSRNHKLIGSWQYENIDSIISIRCHCGHEWSCTARSYKNAKTGCQECKNKAISKVQTGKNVSVPMAKKLAIEFLNKQRFAKLLVKRGL